MAPISRLLSDGLNVALSASAPVLAAALFASLVTAFVIGTWKLDDSALRALPRLALGWIAVLLSAGFVSSELIGFTRSAYASLLVLAR